MTELFLAFITVVALYVLLTVIISEVRRGAEIRRIRREGRDEMAAYDAMRGRNRNG